jgi:hypothetical protein
MQVELQQAHIAISNLFLDAVAAPLYRLPLAISKQALPKLIGDAILDEDEVSVLVEYINSVEELNRGLEHAAEADMANSISLLTAQATRNQTKGRDILNKSFVRHGDQTLYGGAWSALLRIQERPIHRFWRWVCYRWRYGAFGPS